MLGRRSVFRNGSSGGHALTSLAQRVDQQGKGG
jgi:hypothetical protein